MRYLKFQEPSAISYDRLEAKLSHLIAHVMKYQLSPVFEGGPQPG